jgi:hypothetical protein
LFGHSYIIKTIRRKVSFLLLATIFEIGYNQAKGIKTKEILILSCKTKRNIKKCTWLIGGFLCVDVPAICQKLDAKKEK